MVTTSRIRKGSQKLKKLIEKDGSIRKARPSKKNRRLSTARRRLLLKKSTGSQSAPNKGRKRSKTLSRGRSRKASFENTKRLARKKEMEDGADSKETPTSVEEAIRSTQIFTIDSPDKGSLDEKAFTIRDVLKRKKGITHKEERLKDLTWGIGLEHEMHLFHLPDPESQKVDGFIAFDSKEPALDLVENHTNYPLLSVTDKEELEKIPFEASGRKCHGHWVLKKIPISMPEFVTTDPFGIRGKRRMDSYVDELRQREADFLEMLTYIPVVRQRIRRYGPISPYPFGMTNHILVTKPESRMKGDAYHFESEPYEDYTGSYHITMTLPFDFTKTTKKDQEKFIKAHQNFANQLQWLEPLLIASFFSADQKAMGTTEKRVKGSFRVMMTGWGNLAGSDVRKFPDGVGRYADIKSKWRDGLHFHNLDKLKHCEKVTIKEPGAISALSSNFRTFGSTDPSRPWHRESGIGMTMPNGVEFRIFDNFDSRALIHLCRFVVFVAENSRLHQADGYVYDDKEWIHATQEIMKNGWKAQLTKGYVDALRKNLGLKIKTQSLKAFDVMITVSNELYHLHKNGDWTYLMAGNLEQPLHIPQVNRRSWEYGLLFKLNAERTFATKFYQMVYELNSEGVNFEEFAKHFYKYFDKSKWENDIEDVIYFGESYGFFKIKEHHGHIVGVTPDKQNVKNIENPAGLIGALWLITDPIYYREKYLPSESPHIIKRIHEAGVHVFGGITHPHPHTHH